MDNLECSASNITATQRESFDRNGNGLYHLLASGDRIWHHAVKGVEHLRKYKVDPTTRNNDGKTPLMTLRQNSDLRYRLITDSVKIFVPDEAKKRKRKNKNKNKRVSSVRLNTNANKNEKDDDIQQVDTNAGETQVEVIKASGIHCPYNTEMLRDKISKAIQDLKIVPGQSQSNKDKVVHNVTFNNSDNIVSHEKLTVNILETEMIEDKEPLPVQKVDVVENFNAVTESLSDDDNDVQSNTFDNLTWEVECTADVWKKLKDKKLPINKKKQIVNIIRQLANGNMRGSLAKRLVGIAKESNILLFEAKLGKSARILWERAIAFSPRCSALSDNKFENGGGIYTEVIRVWDVVFDHDTVPRKIKNIVRSYNRGTSCFIKKNLKGTPVDRSSLSKNIDQECVPKIYVPRNDSEHLAIESEKPCSSVKESTKMFFPPGSPEETEYHILKFYAFSNAMVDAMLDSQTRAHLDFPFRVSELEHSIINLAPAQASSILLLGRSGTGKTTCCLYRLWNNYRLYWQRNTLIEPSIPNVAQFIPRESDAVNKLENEDVGEINEDLAPEERSSPSHHVAQACILTQSAIQSTEVAEKVEAMKNGDNHKSCCQGDETENLDVVVNKRNFEHLHQVFITKNAVLCKEVQKNFIELSQASFTSRNDVDYQPSSVYKFDELEEQEWPLFICSRDWLLMLDASLPGVPFFQRNENGKLERSVEDWGEEGNNLKEIPVEYSDYEDDEEIESKPITTDAEPEAERDRRREVTYQVFKNEFWQKMTKKNKVDYHPSLVWTEIISFIKGSVEALHSEDGIITLENYQSIGNKRAPSFTADRDTIYELFLAYQRIKRSLGMFDEADVVHHIYHRLEHHIPSWSIHEIYVDETQDFAQAELSVIIRSCRNPNRLFFTGDTAQSIMRGIAFRFSDLRSLFYYMKESVKLVGQEAEVVVPDRVYELTHNYRSHAGILNLASSVTDLLSHFFPESFDKLARDQGLFEGPKPVLLESCSFSDLAVILRGHKRKTRQIEFGAHQVILVTSDEVRNSLPEELSLALVMTIYESKGLEFDDVLLYNFFKDSQALKEWRVVGTYREKQNEHLNIGSTGIAEHAVENLECKARPLEFNADQHKILVSEFKYLYTALTRAKVNLWLFDESEEARAPMFEYFKKRGVVDIKQVQKSGNDMTSLEGLFTHKSGREEWKKQGIFFYNKGFWKVASKCFSIAEEETWVKKCNAYEQAAKAVLLTNEPRKLRLEFLKAADLFLECGMHDETEKCLYNARERILLAKLLEKSKKFLKAAKIFRKERKFNDAARNFEIAGDFEGAMDSLIKVNCYNEALDLVARYENLEKSNEMNVILKPLRYDQRDGQSICYQAAKFYLHRGEDHLMDEALGRLKKVEDRITFLKKNGLLDQAAKLLLKQGKPQEAARLMRSEGKFLEAASFSGDDKFTADCYLLAASSAIPSAENGVLDKETENLLDRASEMYIKCNNLNGQAEVKLTRGSFFKNVSDLEDAGNMYYQAVNYSALTDCFLLIINSEKDPRSVSRPKAIDTLDRLLHLILAFHKERKENSEHTAVAMCYTYFGLQDTEDVQTKYVPHLEMVRFSKLEKFARYGMISKKEADRLITENLVEKAKNLFRQLWHKSKQINEGSKLCPRFTAGLVCDLKQCNLLHESLTRAQFGDRFFALLFLIGLEDTIARFLKKMKLESAKSMERLQRALFIEPEFIACQWLNELLFPQDKELLSSFFLAEADVARLRRRVSHRVIEYAKTCKWNCASEKERWSSSDLFIEVSNLLHTAGDSVEKLLTVEEKKFKIHRTSFHPGMFLDRTTGRFHIFSKALVRSQHQLYFEYDILGFVHAAVKEFLFSSAKSGRRGLPYPSIANAVMILERHVTACLILYARIQMNETIVCLPESYLSMINFWDFVDRPLRAKRSTTLYNVVHHARHFFHGPNGKRNFHCLQELLWSIVALTIGKIAWKYDILNDSLCSSTVNCVEAERVLVMVLTMLCNCGRAIPRDCERMIREHLYTLKLSEGLPEKLKKCIEAARNASGPKEVVECLRELLAQKPRHEKLCDVNWDELKMKDVRRNCQVDNYPINFSYKIDINALTSSSQTTIHEEQQRTNDEVGYSEEFIIEEPENQHQEYNEEERHNAVSIIERAYRNWKARREAKSKSEKDMKNDVVKSHFQSFRLDKSGCTICSPSVQFDGPKTSSDQDEEATWSADNLQRSTFESHCSKRTLHWKQEKSFAMFKYIYKSFLLPKMQEATELRDEMTKLQKESEVIFSLKIDTLEAALNKLQVMIRNFEDECQWESVAVLQDEAVHLKTETERIRSTMTGTGGPKVYMGDSGDEDFTDDQLDNETVGHLKDVNAVKCRNQRNSGTKTRKR